MIGTTLKVGMDTSRVTRGLSKISRGFGAFSKQVGIGAARRVGERMTDLAGRLAMAVPGAIRDTSDYVSTLSDLSVKTGMSVKSLVELQEMFRVSGVQASDTTKVISQMADRLYEARTVGGMAKEALNELGFSAQDFKDKKLDESFFMIGKRVAEIAKSGDMQKATGLAAEIFGMKGGAELLKFFGDMDANIAKAQNNVKGLNLDLGEDGLVGSIDAFADAMGRFEAFRMRLGIGLITTMQKVFGEGYLDKLYDFMNNDVVPVVLHIAKTFGDFIQKIRESGDPLKAISDSLGNIAKSIGKAIGDGFRESLGEIASPRNLIKGLFGGPTAGRQESLGETNRLLARILEKTPGEAVFS